MTKRMLIDGTHPEETRVVVMDGPRLEEHDVETSTKRQLKGNIYLAKVIRVEPSLQAAFVDYGGNRHGFLAFGEIHPDYYQIPIEDREALVAEHDHLHTETSAAREHVEEIDGVVVDEDESGEAPDEEAAAGETEAAGNGSGAANGDPEAGDAAPGPGPAQGNGAAEPEPDRRSWSKRYKIQEVIKRRQILLVQVVKEERGNKGAAITTYLSLAGRYCVLMPNTPRGGGISRKITNATARRKLKQILGDLEIPDGMGVIMRTAGMERNKSDIKRDFEYLMRAWDQVRELTLESTAPVLVYEEANLIKRAIRDLYTRDVDEVLVDGADAYQIAKKFMRLLMPSHAKRVQPYREQDGDVPLFHRYRVEGSLDAMHSPVAPLKSGGSLVIHSTEALVAIDVNSGRSTRERNIEETAFKTNLEAAEEVARQLRLRDLAGLVVIDFIDMEDNRNVRAVERRLKEAVKGDRARIQLGRISGFGLLELSRQRLRPSLLEASTEACRHCQGTGFTRSTESMAIRVLRAIEEEGIHHRSGEVAVAVSTPVALYVLNQKRRALADIERRYGFEVTVAGDDSIVPPDMRLERLKGRADGAEDRPAIRIEAGAEDGGAEDGGNEGGEAAAREDGPAEGGRRRTRRRGRKKTTGDDKPADGAEAAADDLAIPPAPAAGEDDDAGAPEADAAGDDKPAAKRRRRGRRGGRRRASGTAESSAAGSDAVEPGAPAAGPDETAGIDWQGAPQPDVADAAPEARAPDPEPEPDPPAPTPADAPEAAKPPKRKGWWQRIIE